MHFKILVSENNVEVVTDYPVQTYGNLDCIHYGLSDAQMKDLQTAYQEGNLKEYLNEVVIHNFLLVLVDKVANTIVTINDHFGSQEIYYKKTHVGYEIASDIYALNPDPGEISKNAVYETIVFQGILPPDTIFESIKCVSSGSMVHFTSSAHKETEYWDVAALLNNKNYTYEQSVERGRIALSESIKQVAGAKTGVALSGGIDSGGLLGMFKNTISTQPTTISVGGHGPDTVDLGSARKSVSFHSARGVEIYPELKDIKKLWAYSKGLSLPISSSTSFVYSLIHEKASEESLDSVMYGFGAEMLLGNLKISRVAKKLWFERLLPNGVLRFLYKIAGKILIKSKTRQAFLETPNDWLSRFMVVRGAYYPWQKPFFKGNPDEFWSYVRSKMSNHYDKSISVYDSMVILYLKSWVNYLQYRDIGMIGKLNGVMPVIPFDSVSVARVFMGVPTRHRKKNNWNKQLIRDIMRPYVPDHLYSNPVLSLIVPYGKLFAGREKKIIAYLKTSVPVKDLFDFDRIETELADLPEPGFFLMHMLGPAVWYDANFCPSREEEFLKIFD